LKPRILLVFAGLILLWAVLIGRAGFLQIFPSGRIRAIQERQFQTVITLQSRRGAIVDRRGRELALSTTAYSLFADPKLLQGKKKLAARLAKELGMSADGIYAKIKDKDKRFNWIARLLPKEKAEVIKAWDEHGLSFVEEFKRVYPNESLLAHSLGLVGAEGQGLEGIELGYDQQLRGNKKRISLHRDAWGRPLIADGMMFAENPDGAEIKLTVDSEMQHMLEGELSHAVQAFEADQAFGVILDVSTSAVLAVANTPTFDANRAQKMSGEIRRNRVITDTFEPGSTLKTFAVATALRQKIIAPNSKYNTENGIMRVGDRIIREAESNHVWAHLTVSEILAYSSNIGVTKIAFDLGAESLRQGLLDFGFGGKTGVDIPGEVRGSVQPLPWNQHLLSNVSFGQGIAVTALQVANAYAAIANGGVLNTPYVVQSVRDPDSGEMVENKPKPVRRVLSEEDAESMRMMLAGVTAPGGTGINANVEGFLVGGKTGTAQKVNPDGRGYLAGAYISSFAGFIPASDPKFVIYIVVDHPKKTSYYGAAVAAPLFSRVASYAVRMEGLAPVLVSEKNLLPGLVAISTENQPIPAPVVPTAPSFLMAAEFSKEMATPHLTAVPDFRNRTIREVLHRLSGQDLEVKFIGSGTVLETDPAAGTDFSDVKKLTVYLR